MSRDDAWETAMERKLDECLEGDRPWPPQVAAARWACRDLSFPVEEELEETDGELQSEQGSSR
jgi:hypothetical protein